MSTNSFKSLDLSNSIMRVLKNLNFQEMTDIQTQCIPAIRNGHDLIAQSKTGSGKTAAFVIPALEKIELTKANPQILILCPTRELCDQVSKECIKFSKYFENLVTVSLIGGQPSQPQINALMRGVQLIVGTPGRTLEHLRSGYIDVSQLKTLILDEADRLLEEGFAEEMKAIIEALPKDRQTLFFSATFPPSMEELSQRYQKNVKRITIKEPENNKPLIEQYVYRAEKPQKLDLLYKILKKHPSSCTLIFCRTKMAVNEIGEMLANAKISSRILHADLKQVDRDSANTMFRDGRLQVLVATDVAARGLDISRLQLVINFDLPPNTDTYIHRIGRTGRAGRKGVAVSIATEYEGPLVAEIESVTGVKMIFQFLE
jgi:ATP-dependent RNA helicase DbpA